nr:helix-turn-helix transcriptional regulator [Novosphingobium sp. ERN07]
MRHFGVIWITFICFTKKFQFGVIALVTNTYTDNPVLADLSSKQREVLDLVVDRRTNKEISVILGISPSAVEQRLQSVRRKFDVQGRADLARAYLRVVATCENPTGEEKQVSEGADLSTFAASQRDGSDYLRDESDLVGQWRRSGSLMVDGIEERRTQQVVHRQPVLDRLDAVAGLSGRLAAIATTAAAFAFLVVLMTSASQAMS